MASSTTTTTTRLLLGLLAGATLTVAGPRLRERATTTTTLIPDTALTSTSEFESYFSYNYPWGDTHNGAALMKQSQATIVDGAYLQLQSDYTGPQSDNSDLSYNSGTVYAKQHFTVESGGGLDMQADFVAEVRAGTWPAWWLDGVNSWPPEIDLAEWKGSGKISFNTFNTSSEVTSLDEDYPTPTTAWHTVKVELRPAADGTTLKADFYMKANSGDADFTHVTTQYGANMVGEPFYMILDYQMLGSSGSSGPTETTYFDIKALSVTSYNP